MSNEGQNPIRLYESQERLPSAIESVAKRSHYIFKNKDESGLTIEERFRVHWLQLPALQWMPSANENVTKRNYTFKNKDETVLTIEERFRVQLQLPALQWMPSANENVAKRRYTIKKKDELVLTIEERFQLLQLLASQWLVSCEKKCKLKPIYQILKVSALGYLQCESCSFLICWCISPNCWKSSCYNRSRKWN